MGGGKKRGRNGVRDRNRLILSNMSVTDFRVASFFYFYDFILNSNLGFYSKFFALLLEAQKKKVVF